MFTSFLTSFFIILGTQNGEKSGIFDIRFFWGGGIVFYGFWTQNAPKMDRRNVYAPPPGGIKNRYFSAGAPFGISLARFDPLLAPFWSPRAPFWLHFGGFWS